MTFSSSRRNYTSNIRVGKKVQIRIKSNRLYRLQLESPMALIGSHGDKDLNELWHKRMGHLHHGALRIFRSTVTGISDLSTE